MNQEERNQKIHELLEQMTLTEKISLLSGKNYWFTANIDRLGIPAIAMTDGPHGVRTGGHGSGRIVSAATAYPTGISMASTWNRDLIEQVGKALAEETRHLGCHVLLGPCVNIVRFPLGGRNFETYSEDPYLAGQIGIAYVNGVQGQGVGVSVKHFVANNQEFERLRGNSVIDERTLREIYLAAFEMIIKEAHPWTVMCAYNRINGVYASEHEKLLRKILKEEWVFDGVVVSDWGAVHDIYAPITAGLDLEMPGPSRYFGTELEAAVSNWQVEECHVDDAARRMLKLIYRAGVMSDEISPEGSGDTSEHREIARKVAEESIVLLKNDSKQLPLREDDIKKLAVIGLNADRMISGGGSSRVDPHHWVTPLEGLRARLRTQVQIGYEPGYDNLIEPLPVEPERFKQPEGQGLGLLTEIFSGTEFSGEPALTRIDPMINFWWGGAGPASGIVDENQFSIRWTGSYVPNETGEVLFRLLNTGSAKVWLDGELILDNNIGVRAITSVDFEEEKDETIILFEEGRKYKFKAEFISGIDNPHAMVQLLSKTIVGESSIRRERAVKLAKSSDAAIIIVGLPDLYESEGQDRKDMNLPGDQEDLIRAVAAANPNTIVAVNAGSPVAMPWADEVDTILLLYYPGQEGGYALANILFGDVNPSGKLPVSFPKRLEDNPAFLHYPGWKDVHYGERLFVGYRYYDTKNVEPLFPFGHGLSYTEFSYNEITMPSEVRKGEDFQVSVIVENIGKAAGQEVVQLYIRDKESTLIRPDKELKGFEKIALEPGETKVVTFELNPRSLSFYNPYQKAWVAEIGEFEVLVGASSRDIRLKGEFKLIE